MYDQPVFRCLSDDTTHSVSTYIECGHLSGTKLGVEDAKKRGTLFLSDKTYSWTGVGVQAIIEHNTKICTLITALKLS